MRLLTPILAAVLAFPPVPAQIGEEQAPTIKVDVDVVNILCSVRDRRGGLIADLEEDDFQVFEEGQPQTIRYFSREADLPLTIGLLVDVSRSQANLLDVQKRAAGQFLSDVLRKKDLAFLISFGADAMLVQDFTNSIPLLQAGLDGLRISGSAGGIQPGPVPTIHTPRGTILFDTVYLAATEQLQQQVGRKAVVLITDGVDVGSRLKLKDAIEAAQKSDAIIYSIFYADPSAYNTGGGLYYGVSDADLKKMSEETGGRLFRVNRRNPLNEIFKQIQDEMRSQYSIGYSPTDPVKDGSFREVEIRTRQKGLRVQARKGYYAVKPGSP